MARYKVVPKNERQQDVLVVTKDQAEPQIEDLKHGFQNHVHVANGDSGRPKRTIKQLPDVCVHPLVL
jgi:hypothetical protein